MNILLLDEGQHQSLYLSRKLQECADTDTDIHVAIASAASHRQNMLGHFPVTSHSTPNPADAGYAEHVGALARNVDYIIPIGNNCLPIAYNASTTWRDKVFPAITPDTFALLFDKFASTQFAIQLGIRCPDSTEVETLEQLHNATELFGLPIVLKQRSGWAGTGVRICHTREDLEKTFHLFRAQGDRGLFCQRYIRGTPCLAGGLFLHGNAVRIYCADHAVTYPPITGASKSLISCHDQNLIQALRMFCQAVCWTGLGNLDFVRGEDGALYFLEMNPRIWGSIAATADAGVEMICPLLQLMQGESPTPSLAYQADIRSALFPQYLLALCQQGGYRNLWRVISERRLWRRAPWNRPHYLFGYLIIVSRAWLHSVRRTLAGSLKTPES